MNISQTEYDLKQLFPQDLEYQIQGHTLAGWATTGLGKTRILGTVNAAAMNHEIVIFLAREILTLIEQNERTPVVFIVDTQGQDLSRADELLCLNKTFAHLASCVELLRQKNHVNLAIIFGQAVSGGFLSYGLMANAVYAFQSSQVKVMDLNAMARVTKIPVDTLQNLSQTSAIFAPGVENFYKMGAIREIWENANALDLEQALVHQQQNLTEYQQDSRRLLAQQRDGRILCHDIVEKILVA